MTTPSHAARGDDGLAFFGAVTASLSHQLNNALTIVAELNGLTEDLLAGASEGKPVPAERLTAVSQRIASNLERGTGYIRVLNRFAHSADHPDADIDVATLLGLLADINRRFFDLKKAALEVAVPDGAGTIRGSAFDALHALSCALYAALSAAAEGATVSVAVTPEAGAVVVEIAVAGPMPGSPFAPADLDRLHRACRRLGAEVTAPAEPGPPALRVVIPRERGEFLELKER